MTAANPARRDAPLPVLWVALLVLLALVPLPFASNRPWSWSLMALWAALLLAGWAVALWRDPGLGIRWRPLLRWPALLFAAVVLWILVQAWLPVPATLAHPLWALAGTALGEPLSGRTSLAPTAMPAALIRLLSYAIIFWLTLQLCATPARARGLLAVIGSSAAAYAAYGLAVYAAGNDYLLWFPKWAYREDLTSTFVNRNSFATYAGLGMLACTALAIDAYRRKWRLGDRSAPRLARSTDALVGASLLWTVLSVTVAAAWLQSHSRMGFASGALGLLVLYLVLRTAGVLRHGWWLPAATVAALAAGVGAAGELTLARLLSTTEIDRIRLFEVIVRAIGDAPFVGMGYGSFVAVFQLYRDASIPGGAVFTEAHNSYLELALELGIPAAAALVAATAVPVVACARSAYQLSQGRIVAAVAVAAAVLVGLHATLDFSLQIPAVAASFAALLGAGVAATIDG